MWRIGDVKMDGRVVLGPMAGFSFGSYRAFMEPFGTAATMTEMVSAHGLIHNGVKTADFVCFDHARPACVQLFGRDPEAMAEAAEIALRQNPSIDFFDVNMGCPVEKIVDNGAGSAMMADPKLCGDVVRAIKRRVDVPVTAKMRLGWKSINFREVIDEVIAAGADAVTVHARTPEERYTGTPHYDLLEGLGKEMSVPLIVSGNIYALEDAVLARKRTRAEGIMVARGGVGNPYLVTQIDRYFRDGTVLENPTVSQQTRWCIQLAEMVFEEKGRDVAVRKMRSIAPKFIAGCRYCRDHRKNLAESIDSLDGLISMMEDIESRMGDRRILSSGRGPYPDDVFDGPL